MALLYNTDIEVQTNKNIVGHIGRIGGTVNQLLKYADCTVTEINIKNDRKTRYGSSIVGKLRYGYDLLEQEVRFFRKGWRAVRDRKTIWMNILDALTQQRIHDFFDATISSNVVEHSYNSILFFLSTWLITRRGGWQYHAVPCCRFTFDRYRSPTTLSHFVDDFEKGLVHEVAEDADMHFADFEQSATKSNWPVHDYERRIPYLHYHVFDEHNTASLVSLMFEDVTTDIIQLPNQFNDVVILFRNILREGFVRKYGSFVRKIYGITLSC
jgi:hypothetical protein